MPAGQVGGVPQAAGVGVEGAGCTDDEPVDVAAGQPAFTAPSRASATWRTTGCAGRGGSSYSPRCRPVTSATATSARRPGRRRGPRIDGVQLGVGSPPRSWRCAGVAASSRRGAAEAAGLHSPVSFPHPGPRANRAPAADRGRRGRSWRAGRAGCPAYRRICHVGRHRPFTAQSLSFSRVVAQFISGRSLLGKFPIGGRKVGRGPRRRQDKPPPRQQSRYLGRSPASSPRTSPETPPQTNPSAAGATWGESGEGLSSVTRRRGRPWPCPCPWRSWTSRCSSRRRPGP